MSGPVRGPFTTPPLLALSLLASTTSAAPSPTDPVTDEQVGALDPTELELARAEHHALGRRVARRLGMTTDWARTRWVPGGEQGEIRALFGVTVSATLPTVEDRGVIVERLGHRGWKGRVTACTEEVRIDAARGGCELLLLGDGTTLTLTITGPARHVGATQVLHLLAGVYEDEDVER